MKPHAGVYIQRTFEEDIYIYTYMCEPFYVHQEINHLAAHTNCYPPPVYDR